MPFLTLNNLRIPVVEGGERTRDDVGRVSRQATGTLSADRRYTARKWAFKTAPISLYDYWSLRGFCSSTPVTWPVNGSDSSNLPGYRFASTTQSNVTYVSATAADGTANVPGPRFGTHALVQTLVGSNLWPSNVATATDATGGATTGFAAVSGGAIATSTARRWQGTRSIMLTASAIGDGIRTGDYAGDIANRWTASFYVTGTGTFTATLWAGAVSMGSVTFLASSSTWARIVIPRNAATPVSATLAVSVIAQTAASVCYLDGFLLETTTGASELSYPWVDGSRPYSSWRQEMATRGALGSAAGISINMWTTRIFAPGSLLVSVEDPSATPKPEVSIRCATVVGTTLFNEGLTPALVVRDQADHIFALPLPAPPQWDSVGEYKMITAVVCTSPAPQGHSMALYVDGVRVATSTAPVRDLDATKLTTVYFGGGAGERATGSVVDDLTVFPFVLGPTSVKSIYDAAAPMPGTWPMLIAQGQAFGSGPVAVLATLEKAEYLSFFDSTGQFEPNGVSATIALQEVAGGIDASMLLT